MPTINQLPVVSQVSGGDNIPLYVPNQGDARRCSVTTLIEFIQQNFSNVVCETVQTTPVSFANLPNAVSVGAGARAFINDSTTNTYGDPAAGGGSAVVPVWSNGTAWYIG